MDNNMKQPNKMSEKTTGSFSQNTASQSSKTPTPKADQNWGKAQESKKSFFNPGGHEHWQDNYETKEENGKYYAREKGDNDWTDVGSQRYDQLAKKGAWANSAPDADWEKAKQLFNGEKPASDIKNENNDYEQRLPALLDESDERIRKPGFINDWLFDKSKYYEFKDASADEIGSQIDKFGSDLDNGIIDPNNLHDLDRAITAVDKAFDLYKDKINEKVRYGEIEYNEGKKMIRDKDAVRVKLGRIRSDLEYKHKLRAYKPYDKAAKDAEFDDFVRNYFS